MTDSGAQPGRVHSAYHYDQRMRLRVPLPLWLGFALGLAHVLSYWPVMGLLLGPLGAQLADWRLFVSDALNLAVLVAAGFRTPKAGVRMRWLWRHGRDLLLLAHGLAVLGFGLLHAGQIRWHQGEEALPVLLMLLAHAAVMLYLGRSALVRDLFNDYPQAEDDQRVSVVPLPVQKRQRQVQALQRQCEAALDGVASGLDAGARQALSVVKQSPQDAGAWHALGMSWLALGQEALALACVRLAAEIDGGAPLYQQNLGELARRAGDLAAAIRHGQAAVRLAPQDAHAHYNLAVALAQAGQLDAAVSLYDRTLALQPANAAAWNNLGVLWQAKGEPERARHAYDNALRADPGHEPSRVNLQRLQDGPSAAGA